MSRSYSGQLSLFEAPYRYIIDTSSILSQKPNEPYRRSVYCTLWDNVEALMQSKEIVICSEIADEIEDDEIRLWLQQCGCGVLKIDPNIEQNVVRIANEHPNLLNFANLTSSGDAFLIATAMTFQIVDLQSLIYKNNTITSL